MPSSERCDLPREPVRVGGGPGIAANREPVRSGVIRRDAGVLLRRSRDLPDRPVRGLYDAAVAPERLRGRLQRRGAGVEGGADETAEGGWPPGQQLGPACRTGRKLTLTAKGRRLSRQPDDAPDGRRPARPAPLARVELPGSKPAVPGQQCRGRDGEDLRVAAEPQPRSLYRFRTRRGGCDLRFGWMSWFAPGSRLMDLRLLYPIMIGSLAGCFCSAAARHRRMRRSWCCDKRSGVTPRRPAGTLIAGLGRVHS